MRVMSRVSWAGLVACFNAISSSILACGRTPESMSRSIGVFGLS